MSRYLPYRRCTSEYSSRPFQAPRCRFVAEEAVNSQTFTFAASSSSAHFSLPPPSPTPTCTPPRRGKPRLNRDQKSNYYYVSVSQPRWNTRDRGRDDNSQAFAAARDCRAPVVGTGGSSLGTAMAMGCLLVGSSGGSVATTNKVIFDGFDWSVGATNKSD